MLHASVEDLMRGVLELRLPTAPSERLEKLPLAGTLLVEKFGMMQLAEHRGKTVDRLITESVIEWLGKSTFSHPGEIGAALERVGLPKSLSSDVRADLSAMMIRRHLIVHRMDRHEPLGTDDGRMRRFHRALVAKWMDVVQKLGFAILEHC